jgi:MFS family permease
MTVGIGLAIAQQITGINTIIYYAPTIFRFAGFASASSAILASVGIGAVNVVFTIVAMYLIDRVGRRPLLLVSLAGMILGLAVLGLGNLSTGHSRSRDERWHAGQLGREPDRGAVVPDAHPSLGQAGYFLALRGYIRGSLVLRLLPRAGSTPDCAFVRAMVTCPAAHCFVAPVSRSASLYRRSAMFKLAHRFR